ncbi:beta and beta-prime subunits of DNA dependent RNA-polymerase [Mollisia scopiformis]|uniref:DNA-directed RNA polymerase subunit n=1 Tax=Mollisia scopiformis TaxID=149040 RepID=A0A194XSI2_MOLSC|nr:beta and beta-prime subunits of DNA dependent RNA-polymerase [Mollisia scopiformis]KUJ23101.1 beta and beta-prime subunits of DNA dependent RNA-polymerase [Mollisia scopiformis]
MNISQPVPSAIGSVDFGFLSPAEIKKLSVKRIENPQTFDTLLHPVPGGLYDPALGAWGDHFCTTCNLNGIGCPGHVGHIDLPAPVYHPTFMDQLLRLLRSKCAYCHHLKMSRKEVNRYMCKLRLVQHGLLGAAEEIDNIEIIEKKEDAASGEDSDDGEESAMDVIIRRRNAFVKKSIKAAKATAWEWKREKNEGVAEARRTVVKAFLKAITASKACGNCNGISPTFRKDRYVKIFEKALSVKDKHKMAQGDFRAINAVEILSSGKKGNGYADFDEGIADIDLDSNEEDDEGEGQTLDVNGDVVMGEASATTTSKPKVAPLAQRYISPMEVKASLTLLFEKEQEILSLVYNSRSTTKKATKVSPDMFFLQTLLVPPNKYRPEARTGDGEISEAQQNSLYKAILKGCETMAHIYNDISNPDRVVDNPGMRKRDIYDLHESWCQLQDYVNSLIDRDRNPIQGAAGKKNEDGIKQKLEKKEGLFRKNMMGKRVNFAARSVISPDPNIETNEIGVPPVFAKKLTFPEPVTSHNFKDMQQAVINGPDKWPGAAAIENENGQVISLRTKTQDERLALANQLLASSNSSASGARNKKVHRHLTNGDVVLMNRQPTLHKPSIMGHRARVLPGEKTIRMHYANCNTYNADFDGDEMNMHFPQTEPARAEALQIADTDHQYLSATAGKPLRGLIQDHISVSVWMCNRDTFFDRAAYQQLIYNCLRPENGHIVGERIETVPPAILKPVARWTGKQVITTILKNITPVDCAPLTLTSKSQTPSNRWGDKSEEGIVHFKGGEFVTGILDKSQIGPSGGGFVHSIHEVYGPTAAGKVLSILGRLLTKFLHMRAFTCGMDDLRLTPEGEEMRREKLARAEKLGLEVASKYVTLSDQNPSDTDPELLSRLEDVLRDDTKQAGLDTMMNKQSGYLSSDITMACLPGGLVKQFPKNQMQNMTVSGAKGSAVNANLISCNLGQQVLEGRRVPVMVSGKSLPCFRPFETHIRAGGYVVNRFLTGIRPQEYYFHAMAGREGLIDTAVKTSRSGYLQRCLIKGMEGLKVEYDTSVRDSDGSMVQFLYGEDGLDSTKQKHLQDFKFLLENITSELAQLNYGDPRYATIFDEKDVIVKRMKKAVKHAKANDNNGPDPVLADFNPGKYGYATSEKFFEALTDYLKSNPDGLVKDKEHPRGVGVRKALEPVLMAKYLKSVVEPGEAVGIVAGQSVGEPSTQMTLNTFHLAGHSAKNVTLGIPRLREIVMTASNHISTPTMTLRLNPELTEEDGKRFAKGISILSLAEVLDEATVQERIGKGTAYSQAKIYEIHVKLFPSKEYTETYAISISDVLTTLEKKFAPKLQQFTRKALGKKKTEKGLKSAANTAAVPEIGKSVGTIEEAGASVEREVNEDDDDDDGDDDATNDKQRANRAEAVSYAANDEDDDRVQAQMQKEAEPEEDDEDMEDEGIGGSPREPTSDDEEDQVRKSHAHSQVVSAAVEERETRVMKSCNDIVRFRFDEENGEWCDITVEYDAEVPKVLMLTIVEDALRQSLIQQIPNIGGCIFVPDAEVKDSNGKTINAPVVHTEGVNLTAMQAYASFINPNTIYTNDIAAMLTNYGVEACRGAIVQELSGVFGGHGISVDNRHLNLIADHMTRGGGFSPFNRNGMRGSVSPFMKMSFETTVGFLADAVTDGDWDDLSNPSSRIVIGRMSKVGTGAFDVLTQVPTRKGDEEV